VAVTATLLAVVAGVPACGSDTSGELVVYSGRTQNLITPLLDRFADDSGIDIRVEYDDSANLALKLDEEGDQSPADVFVSQSPGAVGFLDTEGRLRPLPGSVLDLVPADVEAGDGSWVGLSGRVRTLVYNTELVDDADLPDSVIDLTDERFRGDVAVAPENGSFQDFVTALRDQEGDDVAARWLEGMAANESPTFGNNTAIVEAVGRGEVPMGLVNHYYAERALAEDPDLPVANHFFPDGDLGSALLVTAAAIPASSDRIDDATRLIEFLLSEEAQTFFAEETFEYPLAAGVDPVEGVPPLDEISVTEIDLDELGGGLRRTAELIDASGIRRG
jgi:iron(III) transport system substrate-binding protein